MQSLQKEALGISSGPGQATSPEAPVPVLHIPLYSVRLPGMRIQFILKKNECYGFSSYTRRSSGLWNSTRFIAESLAERGVHCDIVEVRDNNDIDREVTRFKPSIVIIEALWVVPEKFEVLSKLHPNVAWYIHLHSDMPFLALEGIAMDWIVGYQNEDVGIIANSKESFRALEPVMGLCGDLHYLPNVYRGHMRKVKSFNPKNKNWIDVGCFGAIRPLKNHLLQSLAAIEFAREIRLPLRFHVNGTRTETGGGPVLKNLRSLFEATHDATLVESKWNEPEEFLDYLNQEIDIGMQVSLTETFNVVSADYVTAGVPIVVSKEVKWASRLNRAKDNSLPSIVKTMHRVYQSPYLAIWNQMLLKKHVETSEDRWFDFVHG